MAEDKPKRKMLTATELLKSLEEGHSDIDAETVIVSIIKHVGGVDEFSRQVATMLKGNLPAHAKVRVLGIVADFVKYYTEMKLKNQVNLDDLSLADMETVLKQFMVRRKKSKEREYDKKRKTRQPKPPQGSDDEP